MRKKDLVSIRSLDATDHGFVFATWLKGLRYANDWFEHIDQDIYFKNYQRVVQAIMDRPTVEGRIACLKDAPDVILGYAIVEPTILHWVFVKPDWRNIGLARDLVPKDTQTVTHLTKTGRAIKPDHVIFNPFI